MGANLPALATQFIYADECEADVARQSEVDTEAEVHVNDPACVLYRSSALGRPQGVVIRHSALLAQEFASVAKPFEFDESDRVALTFSFAQEAASLQAFQYSRAGLAW